MVAIREVKLVDLDTDNRPEFVATVPHLERDLEVLERLTRMGELQGMLIGVSTQEIAW